MHYGSCSKYSRLQINRMRSSTGNVARPALLKEPWLNLVVITLDETLNLPWPPIFQCYIIPPVMASTVICLVVVALDISYNVQDIPIYSKTRASTVTV